jgi:excisionase family DNA binding protein
MSDPIQPLAVSIEQACQCLGIGETLLRQMLDDGRLPFSRVPGTNPGSRGRILIRVRDLDNLLTATANPNASHRSTKRKRVKRSG